jgi:tRNA(Ile2) C34 agmatinyltransferase TiaS
MMRGRREDLAKAEPPYCPRCGARMRLRSAALQADDRTIFNFQCLYCGHTHTEAHICQPNDEAE